MENEFLILLQAKLDEAKSNGNINADIKEIQNQIDRLKIQAEIDPKIFSDLIQRVERILNQKIEISNIGIDPNKAVQSAQQTGKQVGDAVNQGVSQSLGNIEKLESFQKSLLNAGMDSTLVSSVADEIGRLNVQIDSLNQSVSNVSGGKNILSVNIAGVDELGQSVKLVRQFDVETGELVKTIESVSTAQQKTSTSTNAFLKQQSQAVTNLMNQINQLNRSANDKNAARPITDESHIHTLSIAYNDVVAGIERMKTASSETFSEEQNNVKTLISNYKSLIAEFRNAENVATQMKSVDISSGIAQAQERLGKLKANASGFEQMTQTILDLDNAIEGVGDKSSLDAFLNSLKVAEAQLGRVKAESKELSQVNKIQFSIDNGEYESKVESLIAKTRQWTDQNGEALISTNALSTAFDQLIVSSNNYINSPTDSHQKKLISVEKELDTQIKTVTNSIRSMNAELAKDSAISSLHNQLADFMGKNGKAVKYYGAELRTIFNQTAQGSKLSNQELAKLKQKFIDIQNSARNFGRLGKTFFQTLRDGMSSFSYWTSSTFLVMKGLQKIKEAISFAKELDSALVNINYTMDITASQLENIGYNSIDMAKNLKTSAQNVLGAVKLYANAKETADSILAKAKPAIMLSNVTGFSGEESAKYLQTIMNQFDLTQDDLMNISDIIQGVSQSMAHDFSDGIVQINEGISTSGEVARAAGIDLAEYASMIGLLVEKTGLAGSQLGNSLKTIITRTTKAGKILGIDEGEISAAETSLRNIGVEVRKTDGEFNEFNDTMRELSKQWDSLSDVEKSNISFNLAGTRQINVIQTLLRNWDEYEELVNKANDSTGVTFENQEKYAASLEGRIKGLSSTMTSIGDNMFKSNDLSVIVSGLTKVAELFDKITSKTKLLGSIGLGAGLFAGIKNVGKPKMFGFNYV